MGIILHLHTFHGHWAPVRGLAFMPDMKSLASGSIDGTIKFWDISQFTGAAGEAAPSPPASEKTTGKKDK